MEFLNNIGELDMIDKKVLILLAKLNLFKSNKFIEIEIFSKNL